jgi:hypothetical protein
MKSDTLKLLKVQHLPRKLKEGILYVSEEFQTAGHICPCGCGSKVITPLGEREWTFRENNGRPSLQPSVGNWQLPCRSHYWITSGKIRWSSQWSDEEISDLYVKEAQERNKYYDNLHPKERQSLKQRIIKWLKNVFR